MRRWLANHVLHRGRFPDGARWHHVGFTEQPWDVHRPGSHGKSTINGREAYWRIERDGSLSISAYPL